MHNIWLPTNRFSGSVPGGASRRAVIFLMRLWLTCLTISTRFSLPCWSSVSTSDFSALKTKWCNSEMLAHSTAQLVFCHLHRLRPENRTVQQWDACTHCIARLVFCQLHRLLCPETRTVQQWDACTHCIARLVLSATLTSPPWKQNGATMRCLHTLHCLTGFLSATLTSLPWKQNGATMRCLHAQYCPAGFLSAARLLHLENRMVQQWDACTCSTALLVLCQLHGLLCPKSKMLWQPNVCVWQLSLASVSTGFLCPDFLLLHMGCWLSAHSSDFPSLRTKCYTTEKRVLCSITLLVLSQLHWFPFPKNLPPMRSLYVTCNTTLLVVHR